MTWMIGDVKVTLVRESMASVPVMTMFPEGDISVIEKNADWVEPFMTEAGLLSFSVHALVIETSEHVILVDPCVGCHRIPGADDAPITPPRFLPDLSAAGYDVEDINVVVCTHLHYDHVGWNTHLVDGKWIPTFPNARYLFGRLEYEHWDSGAIGPVPSFNSAVRPVIEAGKADLVEMNHRISDLVWLEPSPGHSPGHVTIHIASGGQEAIITGDVVHHPVQFAAPHWRMFLDDNPELAVTTRMSLRDRVANSGIRVFGTHFPEPSSGFVERTFDEKTKEESIVFR